MITTLQYCSQWCDWLSFVKAHCRKSFVDDKVQVSCSVLWTETQENLTATWLAAACSCTLPPANRRESSLAPHREALQNDFREFSTIYLKWFYHVILPAGLSLGLLLGLWSSFIWNKHPMYPKLPRSFYFLLEWKGVFSLDFKIIWSASLVMVSDGQVRRDGLPTTSVPYVD